MLLLISSVPVSIKRTGVLLSPQNVSQSADLIKSVYSSISQSISGTSILFSVASDLLTQIPQGIEYDGNAPWNPQ